MSDMEELLKTALRALVHTLENEDKEHEEEERSEFHLPKGKGDPLQTVSGGYKGTEFELAIDNKDNALVPGTLEIKGLKEPLKASFVFSSYRYKSGFYEETVKVMTEKGDLIAEALYKDGGEGILSEVEHADYTVHTCQGELREMKGHCIRITFDNKSPGKPRTISLVPGFGPDKKDAKIL